ncbi:MAG: hypothetical protein LBS69_11065 [Prevotellaceae bacterium]|jgi:hypothetical protein|nr:hypothetical protein [Prevotellaceae bacterium]
MKANKIFIIVFMVCGIISSCKTRNNDNIILTDFTKELILLYVNDSNNLEAKNRKDEIIITSFTDTSYHYLSVFANNGREYKFCREDFVGQTLYLGHLIRVFGDEGSIFYSTRKKNKRLKKCKQDSIIYDPNVWNICFHKDLSFCKMKTYKITVDEDISSIQNLAEKYFNVLDTVHEKNDNEIYQAHEVENSPEFALGEDKLRHIISSNFKIHKESIFDKVPIVVGIIVNTQGKATVNGIIKGSDDIELDNEAIRVAEIICQYEFIPASHREQNVNAIYPVAFLKNDIVP